jgi:flagellar protein FliL
MAAQMYEDDSGGSGDTSMTRKRLSGKKLVLFVLLPLLLIGGAVGGLVATGALGPLLSGAKNAAVGAGGESAARSEKPAVVLYYDLPDILVNLRTEGPRPSFLKLSVSLELDSAEDRKALETVMPRVIDAFQVYLRELRADQLQGSAGLFRLREELLARVNTAAKPARVRDILFKEMLVQ